MFPCKSLYSSNIPLVLTCDCLRICWPQRAEQPTNVLHLTTNLDIAYELYEIRTGEFGLKKIYRTGKTPVGTDEAIRQEAAEVLDNAYGADGLRKRENIMRLREEVLQAWEEGGTSYSAAENFLDGH